jgi:hypothetical protein
MPRDRDDDFDDDRPSRRRDDDDRPSRRRDDDDEPRSRRRDDRDDDRPRRPRRDPDEDDYDDRPRRQQLPADKLRAIAIRQKVLIFCILGYVGLVIAQFFVPEDVRIFLAIPGGVVVLASTVFVFLLAVETYGVGMGILFGFLTLIPCVGLIMLLVVNQQATSMMQRNGVRVGLLGANMADIPDR